MRDASSFVIRGGRVLEAATGRADFADVLVEAGIIREVGPPGLPVAADLPALDATERLLVPGLVNAHTHGHGSLSKGTGDRWSLELLLTAGPWISGERRQEELYLAALLNAAEMIRKGCTAAYDLFLELPHPSEAGLEAVARAYADAGLRAVVAPMMSDRTFYEAIPGLADALPADLRAAAAGRPASAWETSLAAPRALLRNWPFDRSRVRLALAPTIPLHCSDAFMVACRDLAREHGAGLHMHVAESKVQALAGLRRYDGTLVAHLDSLGLLGPDFTAAHAIWLDGDDIARLGDRGASVAHNPGSNLRLGSGLAPVRALERAGVNVGVGTDGSSCSDHQNMFEALRLAANLSRVLSTDPADWLTAAEALAFATAGGARAMGFGAETGVLAPGYRADIVFLDLAHLNYVPLNDPLHQVVNCEDGGAVDSVMVDGRLLLDHGRFTTLNYDRLVRDANAAAERLAGATQEARALVEALQPHVARFCVGLVREPYRVERLGASAKA